jgi:tight adherence protein B
MMLLLIFTWLVVIVFIAYEDRKAKKKLDSLINVFKHKELEENSRSIIDSEYFNKNFSSKLKKRIKIFYSVFGPNKFRNIFIFLVVSLTLIYFINELILRINIIFSVIFIFPIQCVVFYKYMKGRQKNIFVQNFPDALNILSGAMSSGQSIVHAFEYVGRQLDNDVGKEFKLMSERLLMGENPDDVLERSGTQYPYLEYFFFISAIRINLARGGQLKEIINKINRLMFESRSIEKKKNALTSESRMSAKILGILPIGFLFMLKFISPEDFEFVMFQEEGRPLFYYVLFSELIGFFLIWLIIKGVE